MCTAIIVNKKKTFVGWNLDLLDMQQRVVVEDDKVYIVILDPKEGWMPLFGANARGDFVAMPTCWPYDRRSDPDGADCRNVILLDIDLLLGKRTFSEIKNIVETEKICSVPGLTFQSQLSDANGNVLQIVPGQGYRYFDKPAYCVLTNFSPFKGASEKHPWMGLDRYESATSLLENAEDDFDEKDCFEVLKAAAQTVCPTVVSMVFDVTERTVYWCKDRNWTEIEMKKLTE